MRSLTAAALFSVSISSGCMRQQSEIAVVADGQVVLNNMALENYREYLNHESMTSAFTRNLEIEVLDALVLTENYLSALNNADDGGFDRDRARRLIDQRVRLQVAYADILARQQ